MQQTEWQNLFIQTLYFKLKSLIFCACLAWTPLIWSRCPAAYSIPALYN